MHHCWATILVKKKKKRILGLCSKLEETRYLPDWRLGILELFKINCSKFAGYYAHVQQLDAIEVNLLMHIEHCSENYIVQISSKLLVRKGRHAKWERGGQQKCRLSFSFNALSLFLRLFCLFCTLAFPDHEYLPARSAFWHSKYKWPHHQCIMVLLSIDLIAAHVKDKRYLL